ncbi:MAG: hypothetical protein AAF790_09005 [Planctomycetota bacterium]
MLRFDDNPKLRPRNYLARREQRRLLLLVGALGLVVLAMQQVTSPATVNKLQRLFGDPAPAAQADADNATNEPADDFTPARPMAPLDRDRFAAVRDNTIFRSAESDAWFYTLGVLAGAEGRQTAPLVTYAQLASQPEVYRGQPVRLEGVVRRVEAVTPAKGLAGVDTLYRIILRPTGGEVWPVTLYTLAPPAGVPLGGDVRLPGEVVGYFFKNQSYRSRGGVGLTPVVLARGVSLRPAAESLASPARTVSPGKLLLGAAGISAVLVGWLVLRGAAAKRAAKPAGGVAPSAITITLPEE